jgi:hypothetical protein
MTDDEMKIEHDKLLHSLKEAAQEAIRSGLPCPVIIGLFEQIKFGVMLSSNPITRDLIERYSDKDN